MSLLSTLKANVVEPIWPKEWTCLWWGVGSNKSSMMTAALKGNFLAAAPSTWHLSRRTVSYGIVRETTISWLSYSNVQANGKTIGCAGVLTWALCRAHRGREEPRLHKCLVGFNVLICRPLQHHRQLAVPEILVLQTKLAWQCGGECGSGFLLESRAWPEQTSDC